MNANLPRSSSLCRAGFLGCLLASNSMDAAALDASTRPAALANVGIEQRLNSQLPLDIPFRDEQGQAVMLRKYFGGKPVILNFVYHNCPMLCPTVLDGLVQALNALPFDAGKEFEIVTLSFDPADTSGVAAEKKQECLRRYLRMGAANGWHFLTGEAAAIQTVAAAAGFHYSYDAKSRQFAHAAGIMVLTPQAKLSRYFYCISF